MLRYIDTYKKIQLEMQRYNSQLVLSRLLTYRNTHTHTHAAAISPTVFV